MLASSFRTNKRKVADEDDHWADIGDSEDEADSEDFGATQNELLLKQHQKQKAAAAAAAGNTKNKRSRAMAAPTTSAMTNSQRPAAGRPGAGARAGQKAPRASGKTNSMAAPKGRFSCMSMQSMG